MIDPTLFNLSLTAQPSNGLDDELPPFLLSPDENSNSKALKKKKKLQIHKNHHTKDTSNQFPIAPRISRI
jgi:hypothetical protein